MTPSALLSEKTIQYVTSNPLRIVLVASWALRGRRVLEEQIAKSVAEGMSGLPITESVLRLVNDRKQEGASVVLATTSPQAWADGVAAELGVFDSAWGTPQTIAHSGELSKLLQTEYGRYVYVGSARAELPIWEGASEAVTITRSRSLRARVDAIGIPTTHLDPPPRAGLSVWSRQLRVHQWAKNVLVFVPILAAHRYFDASAWLGSLGAFTAFCLLASSVYIWNDLQDLQSDRLHETKRHRPLAAGRVSALTGLGVSFFLALTALVISGLIGWQLMTVLGAYLVANVTYTAWLKRVAVADTTLLGLLYTSRIVAGCAAISSTPSVWLVGFSFFFFTSLAFMKRYGEVLGYDNKPHGRGYELADEPLILALGSATGGVSVVVATLFIAAPDTLAIYPSPYFLWPLVVAVMFWLSRAWFLTHRGLMHDDPVIFAIKDRVSLALLPICGVFAMLAVLVK